VACVEHGVVVAHVPWARPGAKHTWAFEDTCAWLAAHTALSVLTVLLRIAWRTVAAIVPPLSDLRGRPRHRPAGVGRRGP
jgi:hypothetical protein